MDNYIRSHVLTGNPLHPCTHTCRGGRSSETAPYLPKNMCAFLEIEIAFENAWHAEIHNALNLNGIGNTLAQVEMPTGNTYIAMSTTPGYPQGGVLSSLKWSIV